MNGWPPDFAPLVVDPPSSSNGHRAPLSASSWAPVDLAPILAGQHVSERPVMLERLDGACLLYAGKLHSIYGEPESGKGWLAIHACAERLAARRTVLYIDFEDAAWTIVNRLQEVGVRAADIANRFIYIRPDEALTDQTDRELQTALDRRPDLVVIDGVTESMTLQGLELKDNTEIAKWQARIPRRIAAVTGAAVVQIDHVVKDRENRSRGPIGGQHKLAGLDAAYKLDVIEPLARGRTGIVKVTVEKDRHGHVRALSDSKKVAEMRVASVDGAVTVELHPPNAGSADAWLPTRLMEKTSRAIEAAPGLSKRAVREAVTGKAEFVEQAIYKLVSGEFVRVEPGPRGALLHYSTRPYREAETADRVPVSRPCPDRVPDTPELTVSRVPVPTGDTDTDTFAEATPEQLDLADRVLPEYDDDEGDRDAA